VSSITIKKIQESIETSLNKIMVVVALLFLTFQVFTFDYNFITLPQKLIIHVGFVFIVISLRYISNKKTNNPSIWSLLFIVATVAATLYAYANYFISFSQAGSQKPMVEYVFAALLLITLLILCYRAAGIAVFTVLLFFIAYPLFSHYFPGFLNQPPISLDRLLERLYLTSRGLYSGITAVSASFVFILVLFGSVLVKLGAGDAFLNLAHSLVGGTRGGSGKIASIFSALFATISGSAIANAAVTGRFTIPMMIRSGFPRPLAAGIESVASAGGQITPPILAGAVFLMMEFLGVDFSEILLATIGIAIIYYLGVFVTVDFEAASKNISGMSEDSPEFIPSLLKTIPYFIPMGVLFILMLFNYPPERGVLISLGLAIFIQLFLKDLKTLPKRLFEGAVDGVYTGSLVAFLIIVAAAFNGVINLSGIGVVVSNNILSITGEQLIIVLLVTQLVSFILGMGLPSTTTYVLQAILFVPVLVSIGVDPFVAHMFVFYASAAAVISPPVGMACLVTSGIAQTSFWKVSWEALKLAKVIFVLPYFFVFFPELLMREGFVPFLVPFITAAMGIYFLSAGMSGWLFKRATWLERISLIVGSILLLHGAIVTDVAAITLFLIVIITNFWCYRKQKAAETGITA
jgi:TRAP transporter 4TM/12TM fusion protein